MKFNKHQIACGKRCGKLEIQGIRDKLEVDDKKTHEKFTMYSARKCKITKGRWRFYVPIELRYDIVADTLG